MGRQEKTAVMHRIILDTEASQVSAELARRGIPAGTRVHVLVEAVDEQPGALPMADLAQAGDAFDWLAAEPDFYTDTDLVQPSPQRAG